MRLLLASLFLLIAVCANAQNSVADVLRGPAKTVLVTDLPENYRALTLGSGETGGFASLSFLSFSNGGSSNDRSLLLFTLVGTLFVDPDEFASLLEGKRPRIRAYALDFGSTLKQRPRTEDTESAPEPIFAETWIEASRIVQWSPRPDISKETLLKVFGKPAEPDIKVEQAKTLSNAKQVALGVMIYCSDADDQFPYAQATSQAQEAVYPYIKNNSVWTSKNPNGGRLLYNTSLSAVANTSLDSPSETILIWDEKAWPDGRRAVAFADGHANYLNTAQWEQAWARELQRRRLTRPKTGTKTAKPKVSP